MKAILVIVRETGASHRIVFTYSEVYFRRFHQKGAVVHALQEVWDSYHAREKISLIPMRCRLCSYNQPTNMKYQQGSQRYFYSVCKHSLY